MNDESRVQWQSKEYSTQNTTRSIAVVKLLFWVNKNSSGINRENGARKYYDLVRKFSNNLDFHEICKIGEGICHRNESKFNWLSLKS